MKHHIRTTICHAAFGVAAVMAICAIPAANAYADNSGVFQPNDGQFGAGWQVLQAPAPSAPIAAPVPAVAPIAAPSPVAAPIAAPAVVTAPIVDQPPMYTAMAEPGPSVSTSKASQAEPVARSVVQSPRAVVASGHPPQQTSPSIAAALAPTPIPAADKVPVANSLSSGEIVMAAATPDAMPAAAEPGHTFELQAGLSLEQQLQSWAHDAGWTLTWNLTDDWVVPGNKSYGTDFAQAAQQVIEQAANNGADIRADLYSGNRSLVVHQAGALR